MELSKMREQLVDLKNQLKTASQEGLRLLDDASATTEGMTAAQDKVKALRAKIAILQDAVAQEESSQLPRAMQAARKPGEDSEVAQMRRSPEYARAFCRALRNGVTPGKGEYHDSYKILFDALTTSGGTPAGSDGGFLVPEDVDVQVREVMRSLNPLSQFFTREEVKSGKGWRVIDKGATKGFEKLTGEAVPDGVPVISQGDSSMFVKVPYNLETYGLVVPVSSELAADEAGQLMRYLSRYFGKRLVNTENALLQGLLKTLTSTNMVAGSAMTPLDEIRKALNVALDPENSMRAMILTNQDGYNYLDQLKDADGRPLLTPDLAAGSGTMLRGRRVAVLSNASMPTRVVTTTGATKGDYYPVYIGDMEQFATLFAGGPLEMASTDVGGAAFRSYSLEVRGIARLDAQIFDKAAAVRREIFIPAT